MLEVNIELYEKDENEFRRLVNELRDKREPFYLIVDKHRVYVDYKEFEHLRYPSGWEKEVWYQLWLELPDRKIFLMRVHYDFELYHRFRNKSDIIIGDGYVRLYGKYNDDYNPLDVLNKDKYCYEMYKGEIICFEKKLNEGMSVFGYDEEDKLWRFIGNYKHYSGAFCFLIWDEKLAEEVRKMLVQKGYGNIVWK